MSHLLTQLLEPNPCLRVEHICTRSLPTYVGHTALGELRSELKQIDQPWIFIQNKAKQYIGVIKAQTVSQALQYPIDDVPIKAFIENPVITLLASTLLKEFDPHWVITHPVSLVMDENQQAIGYLDTDTLNKSRTRHQLSAPFVSQIFNNPWIEQVSTVATELSIEVYLIGGWVRDALQGYPNKDLDFAVVGDVERLTKTLAEKFGGEAHAFLDFGGMHWIATPTLTLDFTICRTETYPTLASLPTVSPTDIDHDLRRRDFNLNAMAIGLTGIQKGILIDLFDGLGAITDHQISTLHALSWWQDPTRIFRAARYCTRYSSKLSSISEQQLQQTIPHIKPFEMLSVTRIGIELKKIFEEDPQYRHPSLAWDSLKNWNLWTHWMPKWQKVTLHDQSQLTNFAFLIDHWRMCWWMQLCLSLDADEQQAWQLIISIQPGGIKAWTTIPKQMTTIQEPLSHLDHQDPNPVVIGRALHNSTPVHWLLLECLDPSLTPHIQWWIDTGKDRKRQTTGTDLLNWGVPRGPMIATCLQKAQDVAWSGGDAQAEKRAISQLLLSQKP